MLDKRLLVLFGLLMIILGTSVKAQIKNETGEPFITSFGLKDHGGDVQTWAFVQDNRGVIYAGNQPGILEYDGANWRMIPTSNLSFVRSLDIDSAGRIFVGAQSDFGYLAADESGRLKQVSLLSYIDERHRNFDYVWTTKVTDHGIYFQTREWVFRFTPQPDSLSQVTDKQRNDWKVDIWEGKSNFYFAFWVNNTYYIHQGGVGLMKMVNDSLCLLPGGEQFANDRLQVMLPLDRSGESGNILVGTFNRGFFLFDGKKFSPFKTPADHFLRENTLYDAVVLSDGSFALATISGGVIIIDRQGEIVQIIDQSTGLASSSVLSLFTDRDGLLWIGAENGIHIVEIPSPTSRFTSASGLDGSIYTLVRHQGILYAGSSTGIFYLDPNDSQFKPVKGLLPGNTQTFSLLSFDNDLLAAVGSGLYRVTGSQATIIIKTVGLKFSPNWLARSQIDPQIIFSGGLDGFYALKYNHKDETWINLGIIADIRDYVPVFEEVKPGVIWLGTNAHHTMRLKYSSSSLTDVQVERFDEQDGLPSAAGTVVRMIDGKPIFHTMDGTYRFDEKNSRFIKDTTYDVVSSSSAAINYNGVRQDKNNNIWINFGKESALMRRQADGSALTDKAPFLRFADEPATVIYPENNGIVWFGSNLAVIRFDSKIQKDYTMDFKTIIRDVIFGEDSVLYGGYALAKSRGNEKPFKPILDYSNKAIRFDFAAPFYINPAGTEYQSILDGFDDHWSMWSAEHSRTYTNLPHGEYTFRVRAKNLYQHVSDEDSFPFTVLPPWYASLWAYLFYVIGAVALVLVLIKIRTGQLKAYNRDLENTVRERTYEIQQRAEELAVINSVQDGLVRELDIQTIYNLVGDKIRDIFEAQAVMIATFDHEKDVENFQYMIEKGVKYYPEPRVLEGVRRHLIQTRETVLINKDFEQAAAQYGMRVVPGTEMPKSLLFVPLVLGDSVKGYISLQNIDRENAFTDDDTRLLTTLANSMSVSLENARLFDETNRLLAETRERATELAIINSVGEGLAQQLDFQAIIDLVGDKICEVFGAQVVTISMYNSKNNTIHHRYMIERGKRFYFEEPQPIEKNRLEIVTTRKPLVFGTLDEMNAFDGGKVIAGESSKSFMGVPIILGNEATGVITVQDLDRENLFDDSEVRLLMTLSSNMGVALENARLFSETTQKASELATVNDISRALVSQLEFDALIRLVGEKMVETFKADIVYLALLDKKRNMVDFPFEYGDQLSSIPYGEGLTSRIISTGKPLLVNRDLKRIHKEMGISTIGVPAASYLGVPISVGGENIGVISVQSTTEENRFDEDSLRLLSTIAANVGVVMQNAESYRRLNETLENLKATQQQLVTQEKLASLGALTAGIAHEIKNPLNFVNNFAELSVELVEELQQEISSNGEKKVADIADELNEVITDLIQNAKKINEHGKRADSIVRSMLQHSRGNKGERLETDINAMLEEDLNLAYHGMRAQDSSFNINIEKNFDISMEKLALVQQDISRVFLNMITNGFYAAHQKKLQNGNDFSPSLNVRTVNTNKYVEIYIRDNGIGIPDEIKDKLFQPFFTTKPAGSGTGLGLSISYEIVVQEHGGKIEISSQPGEFTEFVISLPKKAA